MIRGDFTSLNAVNRIRGIRAIRGDFTSLNAVNRIRGIREIRGARPSQSMCPDYPD